MEGTKSIKNGNAFPIAIIAFALGAFTPYFYLKEKIENTNSKVDSFIQHANTNEKKKEDFQQIVNDKFEPNKLSKNSSNKDLTIKVSDSTNL